MPYQSEKQRRFVKGVASGSIRDPDFTQAEAQSFASHSKGLPVRKPKAKKAKTKKDSKPRTPRKSPRKVARKAVSRPSFKSTMGY